MGGAAAGPADRFRAAARAAGERLRPGALSRTTKILLGVAVALVLVRLALPEVLEWYANRVLDRTEDYEGRIGDVDVALLRGGYAIESLRLDHREKQELRPLLASDQIDLTLEWRALLEGSVVGDVEMQRFVYNVVAAAPEEDEALAQSGEDPDLAERLSELFPFDVNRLEIHDGELHYRDPHREPRVDIALRDVELLAKNWSNVEDRKEERFGRAWLRAHAFESARVLASLEADPTASPPEFVFALVAEGIDLRELNDFLRAYGGFDVSDGTLSIYMEIESRDGRFEGYLKPLVTELDVVGEEPNDDLLERFWEGVVGVLAELVQNRLSGRQAARIPIEGEWGDPSPDLFAALASTLSNAFIQALPARLEHPERLEE